MTIKGSGQTALIILILSYETSMELAKTISQQRDFDILGVNDKDDQGPRL